jgi:hypothetical protein
MAEIDEALGWNRVGRWMEDGAVDGRESGGWRRSEKEGVGVVRVVSLHTSYLIYLILSRIATKRCRNT